jgi:hypothetical protein
MTITRISSDDQWDTLLGDYLLHQLHPSYTPAPTTHPMALHPRALLICPASGDNLRANALG